MSIDSRLDVWLRGQIGREQLERLRERLDLKRKGRLTDSEDMDFGYRYLDDGGGKTVLLNLLRYGDDRWRVRITYESAPPPDDVVHSIRSAVTEAAGELGLEVNG